MLKNTLSKVIQNEFIQNKSMTLSSSYFLSFTFCGHSLTLTLIISHIDILFLFFVVCTYILTFNLFDKKPQWSCWFIIVHFSHINCKEFLRHVKHTFFAWICWIYIVLLVLWLMAWVCACFKCCYDCLLELCWFKSWAWWNISWYSIWVFWNLYILGVF